jgi:2-polyprenyl-3-methyl-5-hydroxy-6-metoxy-1,4-benzoquinol methylase
MPEPADFVICNDVLEHVEPECVDAVLDHLAALVRRVGLIGIATKYALSHQLPDGRNPHLSVHSGEWWQAKLQARFAVAPFATKPKEFACVVTRR